MPAEAVAAERGAQGPRTRGRGGLAYPGLSGSHRGTKALQPNMRVQTETMLATSSHIHRNARGSSLPV